LWIWVSRVQIPPATPKTASYPLLPAVAPLSCAPNPRLPALRATRDRQLQRPDQNCPKGAIRGSELDHECPNRQGVAADRRNGVTIAAFVMATGRPAKDREDSGTDELTGVSRRGAGLAAIGREINRVQRVGGELVAAYVDVDGLKATNDTRGHAAGDALLIAVADSLRACLRSYDVITRVGGDEFVCALPGIAVDQARRRFEAVSRCWPQVSPPRRSRWAWPDSRQATRPMI
jgi:GGDEF domain-containing protein